jgi:hypothetical protein
MSSFDRTPEDAHCPSRDPAPKAVVAAFITGREAASGEWRSICRLHDTDGRIFVLMRDVWPLAVRWQHGTDVRIDVHSGAAPTTKALIDSYSGRAGVRIGNACGDWGLFNVLRSRSVPCR